MVTTTSLRPFQRRYNGVLIHLRLDEWPSDVPLPDNTAVVKTGDGPFMPYWRLVFEPEQTIEVVIGWFKLPCSLDETIVWYQSEMEKRGWSRDTAKEYQLENSAGLTFQHPETGVRVALSMRWRELNHTSVMIRRVTKRAWPPPGEPPTAAQGFSRSDDEGMSQ